MNQQHSSSSCCSFYCDITILLEDSSATATTNNCEIIPLDYSYKLLNSNLSSRSNSTIHRCEQFNTALLTFIKASRTKRKISKLFLPFEWSCNKSIMIEYLKRYGMGLRFVNRKLWDDYEIVCTAATECGGCLQFLPKNHQLLDNPIIGYQAVKSYEYAIAYLSDNLKNDKKILLRAIKSKYTSIPNNFRNDRDVIIQALSNFPSLNLEVLVPTLNDSIFDDEEIMLSIRRRVIDFCIMKRMSPLEKGSLSVSARKKLAELISLTENFRKIEE